MIETLDEYRTPEAVCACLQRQLAELRSGTVDPQTLAIDNRMSKTVEEYTQSTRTVAALERATDDGLDPQSGQTVSYVVVDDDKRSRNRVVLAHENPDKYDTTFYSEPLCCAAESMCSLLGWRCGRIERFLND